MVFSVPGVNEPYLDPLVRCRVVFADIFAEMAHVVVHQCSHTPPASSVENASDERILVLAALVIDQFTPRLNTAIAFPAVGTK